MPEVVEFKLTDPKKYPIYPFKRTTHHNSTLRVHAPSQTLDPETGLKIGSIMFHYVPLLYIFPSIPFQPIPSSSVPSS